MTKFTKKRTMKKRVYKKRVFKKKVSTAIKAYVKRTIHADIENKTIQVNSGTSFGNVQESPDFNAYPMAPIAGIWSIPQGGTQGARIGNKIQIRKVMLNYILRPAPYDPVVNVLPQPCEVQLLLGFVKQQPTIIPTGFEIASLFQNGSVTSAPIGSLRDIISIINTDYWTIKKRWTHKVGFSQNAGTGGLAASQYFSNNDFKMNIVKKINITKMLPKTFTFNDGFGTCTNRNLFFMFYAVSSNGSILGPTQLPTNIEFWIDYVFEDA